MKFKIEFEIECGEFTCASAPGKWCRFARTQRFGTEVYCEKFSSTRSKFGQLGFRFEPLEVKDGWTMRHPDCLEATKEEGQMSENKKQEMDIRVAFNILKSEIEDRIERKQVIVNDSTACEALALFESQIEAGEQLEEISKEQLDIIQMRMDEFRKLQQAAKAVIDAGDDSDKLRSACGALQEAINEQA